MKPDIAISSRVITELVFIKLTGKLPPGVDAPAARGSDYTRATAEEWWDWRNTHAEAIRAAVLLTADQFHEEFDLKARVE